MHQINLSLITLFVLAASGCGGKSEPAPLAGRIPSLATTPKSDQVEQPKPAPAVAPLSKTPESTPLTLPPDVPVPAESVKDVALNAQPGDWPRYKWQGGGSHRYWVTVEADLDEAKISWIALCNYTVQPEASKRRTVKKDQEVTAFCVHPEGYFITTADAVGGASSVELSLHGKAHTASVVVTDEECDLALLRIDAQGLAALPLLNGPASKDQVLYAITEPQFVNQEANGKVLTGSILGTPVRHQRRIFETNFKETLNDGTPLLNDAGQVVGMISSQIAEAGGSTVTFAARSTDAQDLLNQAKVRAPQQSRLPERGKPFAVMQAVVPALATIKARPAELGTGDVFAVSCSGSIHSDVRYKRGFSMSPFRTGLNDSVEISNRDNSLRMDSRGAVLTSRGQAELPLLLGDILQLVVIPLPAGETTWSTEKTWTAQVEVDQDNSRSRYGALTFTPIYPWQRQQKQYKTVQLSHEAWYTLGESTAGKVEITKRMEASSQDENAKAPSVQLSGDGKIVFDTEAGMPTDINFKGDATITVGMISIRFPITMKCEYKTPESLAAARGTRGTGNEAAQSSAGQSQAIDPALKSADFNARLAAIQEEMNREFARVSEKHRLELAKKLQEAQVGSQDRSTFKAELDALQAENQQELKRIGEKHRTDLAKLSEEFGVRTNKSSSPTPAADPVPTPSAPAAIEPLAPAASTPARSSPSKTAAAPERPFITDAQLTPILLDLSGSDSRKRSAAIRRLMASAPNEKQREQVAKALADLCDDENVLIRMNAIKALATWGDESSVTKLVTLMNSSQESLIQSNAIETLGKLKYPGSAEAIARRLSDATDQSAARRALISLGPTAEPAVIAQLESSDAAVRRTACEILAEIGTHASVDALTKVASDSTLSVRNKADAALKAIATRGTN